MKLIDSSEVCNLLGISKSTLYRWCGVSDDGSEFNLQRALEKRLGHMTRSPFETEKDETPKDFPKPFKLGRAYKWSDKEILSWLETKRVR